MCYSRVKADFSISPLPVARCKRLRYDHFLTKIERGSKVLHEADIQLTNSKI